MHFNLFCFINDFDFNLINNLPKTTSIIFRNYNNPLNINSLIKTKNLCKKMQNKLYLANNIKLALKLNLDGAYIPAFNKSFKVNSYNLKIKFKLIGSAHNLKEIRIKELQNVQNIFISSIFKKNQNYLGLNKFKLISNYAKKNTVALGGITKKNLKKLNLVKINGFAGISYFS